jgi:hypothetical protein
MGAPWFNLWPLVIVAAVLAGWWLALRPRASYRGVATPVSLLIVVAAILLCVLALSSPRGRGPRAQPGTHPITLNNQG